MDGTETYQQLVEHLPEIVWLLDDDLDEILYANPTYKTLLKELSPTMEWPVDAEDLVHPKDETKARSWFETVRHNIRTGDWETEYPFEARLTDSEGNEQWLKTIGVPIVENDELIGFAGVSSDITEYVNRENELKEKISHLDQFASMITHDLRTPLSVARANLKLYHETNDAQRLDNIDAALDRMDELTNDLLTLARGRTDKTDLSPVDLEQVATSAWDAVDTYGATIAITQGEVVADESMFQTLLENLFRNAVEHGGTDVTVRVGPLENGFFIEDSGSGIPADLREQVLEHGYSTGIGEGGTGLTIILRVAEAHDWEIDIGDSPEGGARFEFHSRN